MDLSCRTQPTFVSYLSADVILFIRGFPAVVIIFMYVLLFEYPTAACSGPAIGIVFAQDVQVRIQRDWVRDP